MDHEKVLREISRAACGTMATLNNINGAMEKYRTLEDNNLDPDEYMYMMGTELYKIRDQLADMVDLNRAIEIADEIQEYMKDDDWVGLNQHITVKLLIIHVNAMANIVYYHRMMNVEYDRLSKVFADYIKKQ